MNNNSNVNLQNNPIRIITKPVRRSTFFNGGNETASAVEAPYGTNIERAALKGIQRDPSWIDLPLTIIVRKLRSSDSHIVKQAVEELRARGCLSDSTLAWICLRYANLSDANLSTSNFMNADFHKADLERTDLSYANLDGARLTRANMQSVNLEKASLQGANLVGANLQGAMNVSDEQFVQVCRMRGSIFPEGIVYDGRYNLQGDFVDASILHVDLNSPAAIASFYGVSLEDFLFGQKLRQMHMQTNSAWKESVSFQNAELIMAWL
jgi:uncharacterized protein YjbI with pentapeptide repeats